VLGRRWFQEIFPGFGDLSLQVRRALIGAFLPSRWSIV
jgi:hypothetical protein